MTIHQTVTAAQKKDDFLALVGQDELLTLSENSFERQAYASGDKDNIAECYCMCAEIDEKNGTDIAAKTWVNMKLKRKYLAFQGACR